jgi:hypothetical protein
LRCAAYWQLQLQLENKTTPIAIAIAIAIKLKYENQHRTCKRHSSFKKNRANWRLLLGVSPWLFLYTHTHRA